MEIRDLQHLLSLDRHRHFGRAAEALGLTQPALTKSLQRLEKELGVQLFDRSRTGVAPTAVGREVIRHARQLVADASGLKQVIDRMRGVETGAIQVGVGPAMSESFVTTAIARIAMYHPSAQIGVRVDHWRQLSDWLAAGELDLFVADISEASQDARFQCTPLPPEEIVWFCRAEHPLARSATVSREEMVRYPLATPKMPPWAVDWFAKAGSRQEGGNEEGRFPTIECESYSMLKRLVSCSDCISAALQSTIRLELDSGFFCVLRVNAPTLKTTAGIVQLRDRTPSPLAAALTEEIMNLA